MRERFEEGESRFQRVMYINRKNIILDNEINNEKYISHKWIDKLLNLLKIKKKAKK